MKTLILTFDTERYEPHPGRPLETENVPKVLKLLDKHGVKATFFVLGRLAETFAHIIRSIKAEDHEIACHSYEHKRLTELSEDEQREQIRKGKQAVEKVIEEKTIGFRAPYGKVSKATLQILKEEGFLYDSFINLPSFTH